MVSPSVSRVVLLSLDRNYTAQPGAVTSRHPFLPEIRGVEHAPDFRVDIAQQHPQD